MREFGRNPKKYVDTLPVNLTIYGKCVATIIPFEGKVSTDIKKVTTQSDDTIKKVSTENGSPTKKEALEKAKEEVKKIENKPVRKSLAAELRRNAISRLGNVEQDLSQEFHPLQKSAIKGPKMK